MSQTSKKIMRQPTLLPIITFDGETCEGHEWKF